MKVQHTAEKKTSADIAPLLIPAQMGSKEAQWKIVQSFEPLVKKLLHREKDPFKQEDFRSELTLGILEAIHRFSGSPQAFSAYVGNTLKNITGHYLYYAKREREIFISMNGLTETYKSESCFTHIELQDQIQRALQAVPPEMQQLIFCRLRTDPVSWKELSRQYQKSPSTLHEIYTRSLKKVKEKMKQDG